MMSVMRLLLELRAKAVLWDTVVLENKHPYVRRPTHALISLQSLFNMTPGDVSLCQEWLAEEYVKLDQRKRGPTVCQFLHTEKAFVTSSKSHRSVSLMIPSSYKVLYHSF